MFEIEIRHEGLNKYRYIKGSNKFVVEQKAFAQQQTWDEMWIKKQTLDRKKKNHERKIEMKRLKQASAIEQTNKAQKILDDLDKTLALAVLQNTKVSWSTLLNNEEFPIPKPLLAEKYGISVFPQKTDLKYKPQFGFFETIFPFLREDKIMVAENSYNYDYNLWRKAQDQHKKEIKLWEKKKEEFELNQESINELIIKKKKAYLQKDLGAFLDYCDLILTNSIYPDYFPQKWDVEYLEKTKTLIVDYSLPDIDVLPTLKTVKYVATRDEYTKAQISSAALNKLYDSLLYQITLRTIYELFESDSINALDMIVFNGWVEAINRATGQTVNTCVLSLQTNKDEFASVNLSKVDPKACFKLLRGIGSSKLHGLVPIAPVMTINKEDKRFTAAYSVIDDVDQTNNLAAMDWQDFENLIREVFEKEFSDFGGEVKITQASRDGGVDAIAYNPHPILGGKTIIQAKRYTNTVGLSAVRDLYGTTMNEGANKGILVTTADYGPDAYTFAKDKQITLINGNNLLHLLEKHGHRAKIDLKEAKTIIKKQDANKKIEHQFFSA